MSTDPSREPGRVFWAAVTFGSVFASALLACVGYFCAQAHAAIGKQQGVSVQIVAAQNATVEKLELLTTQVQEFARLAQENDRRITRREDNQFTARDGAELERELTKHATLLARQAVDLAEQRRDTGRLEAGMLRLWQTLRDLDK